MLELSIESIEAALRTKRVQRLGVRVLYFPSIGSTNDVAKEEAGRGAEEGLLVLADEQTAGRGRGARSWWAPPGSSLLMSLLLRPPLPPEKTQQAQMCLGLGAVEGIAEATGLAVGLKWPNDLVVDGRKLAGMLTEMDAQAGRLNWVVPGLGLNVNLDFAAGSVPAEVAGIATSLSTALGHPVDRLALLAAIVSATEGHYERLRRGESPHEAWASHLDTLGRAVTVTLPRSVLRGVATGVNPEGALLVRDEAGELHTVWAGDVMTARTGP